jgi:hypothetical protein
MFYLHQQKMEVYSYVSPTEYTESITLHLKERATSGNLP